MFLNRNRILQAAAVAAAPLLFAGTMQLTYFAFPQSLRDPFAYGVMGIFLLGAAVCVAFCAPGGALSRCLVTGFYVLATGDPGLDRLCGGV